VNHHLVQLPQPEHLADTDSDPDDPALQVRHIELRPAPAIDSAPSTYLQFELANESASGITDIILEISILKTVLPADHGVSRTLLAGPIVIHSKFTLKPGFTMKYELRLRNFSAECACLGAVKVRSARAVPAGISGQVVR
jgi:hypothetical protein